MTCAEDTTIGFKVREVVLLVAKESWTISQPTFLYFQWPFRMDSNMKILQL